MSNIDIRTHVSGEIRQITIRDPEGNKSYNHLLYIEKQKIFGRNYITLVNENTPHKVVIRTKQDLENTIKALQFALELEWCNE